MVLTEFNDSIIKYVSSTRMSEVLLQALADDKWKEISKTEKTKKNPKNNNSVQEI